MSFFQNTCKPVGLGGKLMVSMMNAGHAPMRDWGLQYLYIEPEDDVLDIGCGGGATVQCLLEKVPRGTVKGVDYSDVSVAKSVSVNQAAICEGRCKIVQGNVKELPFPDESFNEATAFETIYLWPELQSSFEQVCRVLKSGGSFMICNESNGEDAEGKKWASKIDGMSLYTAAQLEELLKNAGFSQVKTYSKKAWLCVVAVK